MAGKSTCANRVLPLMTVAAFFFAALPWLEKESGYYSQWPYFFEPLYTEFSDPTAPHHHDISQTGSMNYERFFDI